MTKTLKEKVAVVTGASRGAGRAIAAVLGEAGATVYVTGRTVRGAAAVDGLPGTVDDAADEVTSRGGHGIAVHFDHTIDRKHSSNEFRPSMAAWISLSTTSGVATKARHSEFQCVTSGSSRDLSGKACSSPACEPSWSQASWQRR
jgi:NAD(P)-dependent dehydrogenase (short-subunit alcohol dehydrogenase family)